MRHTRPQKEPTNIPTLLDAFVVDLQLQRIYLCMSFNFENLQCRSVVYITCNKIETGYDRNKLHITFS